MVRRSRKTWRPLVDGLLFWVAELATLTACVTALVLFGYAVLLVVDGILSAFD